ncbi:MAG: hypothetical protein K8S97_08940 [Anaerolineae bacterium]|nr:hypothetical protein [Anaerolineae bacterium]
MQNPPTPNSQRQSTATALTLFVLGTTVGLLSLLARLGQEVRARLLTNLSGMWSFNADTTPHPAALPPLLRDLDRSGTPLILAGFALSTLYLLIGGVLWRTSGQPPTRRARAWTRCARSIAGSLWIAMLSAAMIVNPGVRNALILAPGLIALVLFVAFVYLLIEVQFLNSAPADNELRSP